MRLQHAAQLVDDRLVIRRIDLDVAVRLEARDREGSQGTRGAAGREADRALDLGIGLEQRLERALDAGPLRGGIPGRVLLYRSGRP